MRAARALSIAAAACAALLIAAVPNASAKESRWERYKNGFITVDGRTIDYGQGHISHSEGQGYAMFLAVANNDKKTFETLWKWTQDNLMVREDNLFAWEWGRREDGTWSVIDKNNATDGDIMIAYALIRASAKWKTPEYLDSAKKIIADIRKLLVYERHGRTFLLPSVFGFVKDGSVMLNPSYAILPAYRAFSKVDNKKFWEKVFKDSRVIMREICFGSMCLPADWVETKNGSMGAAFDRSVFFGADAVRVILYAAAADVSAMPEGADKMLRFYSNNGYIPLSVDLKNDFLSLTPAPGGYYAVYALAALKKGDGTLYLKLKKEADKKLEAEKDDYYSLSLHLLAEAFEKNEK
ncbi:MAG: glycosyl hydrolase family 8 [Deltaproteobacteria bacterium]|nr:glycosyl hydrolase family 8 [Deltaproteobacteria bacterium]